jgi:hypothetical protein
MRIQGNLVLRSCQFILYWTLLTLTGAVNAQAQRDTDEATDSLIVEEAAGAVKIKFDNRWRSPSAGMTVSLPATISTGADGSIRIRQAATVISVASNTAIELLAGTEPGSPLQRVVQNQGSAFYDIAPRESSRLRVETPYLVAVIKGTEFNVTVATETATIALFEGRLQVEAPDVGDVVDLYEDQIAKRHKDDPSISVLSMQNSEPVAPSDGAPLEGETVSDEGSSDVIAMADGSTVDDDNGNVTSDPDVVADLPFEELAVGLDDDIDIGDGGIEAGLDARVDPGIGDIDAGLELDSGLGDVVVDPGLDADLDLNGLDVALDAVAGIGDGSVDLDVDAGLDLAGGQVDAGLDVGVDLGDAVADLGIDAGIDLDGGDIDLALDSDVDLGSASVDAGIDAGVDFDDGDIDAVVDAGIDLADTTLDAGVDLGGDDTVLDVDVELGVVGVVEGGVGADVDLGDLDNLVDLDLDLLDGDDSGSDSDGIEDDEPADLPINPRDLLDLL